MWKPSKQHRFDCGVKIAQFRSYVPKLYSYMRKCRLKYLEHVLKKITVHNNGAEWQQSSWQLQRHENVFLTSIWNNVVTFIQRKLRKLTRKSAQNTAHEHVVAVCTTSMANVTRHAHVLVWRHTEVMTPVNTVGLEVILLLD